MAAGSRVTRRLCHFGHVDDDGSVSRAAQFGRALVRFQQRRIIPTLDRDQLKAAHRAGLPAEAIQKLSQVAFRNLVLVRH